MNNTKSDLSLLDKVDKKKFYFIIFLGLFGTLFEVIGVGLIVPFVIIITDVNVIENNIYIQEFSQFLNIDTRKNLIEVSIFILIFIYLLKLAYLTYFSWVKQSYTFNLQAKISSRVFRIFLKQPYIYFSKLNSSKLIQETKDEPAVYCSGMIIGKIDMLSEILIICGLCFLLLSYSLIPSLIIFVVIALIVVIYKSLSRKSALVWGKQKKYFESLAYNLLKYVYNSIIEVKINSKEKIVSNKYSNFVYSGNKNLIKQMFMLDVPRLYIEFIAVFLFLVFIFVAFIYYDTFDQFLPTIALFAISAFKILPSINRVIVGIQKINFSRNSVNVINRLLEIENVENEVISTDPINFKKKIQIKNISFSYLPNKKIINDLNLDLNYGEIIGIKGVSGSGKTTLVNLLLGLLKPDRGEILIDDKNLDKNIYEWQKLVSYAPQRTYILDDTIKKNICFEEEESNIDNEYLRQVLRLSSINNFVESLDENLNTIIGENGSQLSGGQVQRIGFARAIYKNPKFIVLDEITSSLDAINEEIILDSIKSLSKKMTILIISHRENTLKICDKIFELNNGNLKKIRT